MINSMQKKVVGDYISSNDTIKNLEDLTKIGVSNIIRHHENSDGTLSKTIICKDHSQWDYIPEDQYYELRTKNLFIIS